MLKRFLKFFKGHEHAADESFEGSYLDHLLGQVRPFAADELEYCPEHDPLLLVVVGVLRATMLNAWSPELRRPLVDSQSPGMVPPPPPATPASLEGDDGGDEDDDGEAGDGPVETAEFAVPLEEDSEVESIDPDDVVEAAEVDEETGSEGAGWTRQTQEIALDEIRAAQRAGAGPADTAEMQAIDPTADPTVETRTGDLDAQSEEALRARPRLDSEEVLQAARVFLGLLIENDRLPTDLQLSVGEMMLARDLLLGYFVQSGDFDDNARRLLSLVEQKFGDGLFSQARILLKLFHTDQQTRVNNDRNLFYEDMILRLGIRRRHRVSLEESRAFRARMDEADDEAGRRALFGWLSEEALIKFHFLVRDPADVARWKPVVARSTRPGVEENFARYLPPRRWRPIDAYEGFSVEAQALRHVCLDAARDYVLSLLKTCYFVLRAVGDTGLEGYLDTFFDWSSASFGVDGTVLMPRLYKRSMMEHEPMVEILGELYDEFYAEKTAEIVDGWGGDRIRAALGEAIEALGECDLGDVAPGYYDLGGLVFDRLFDVRYPSAEFAFKLHRLT